MADLARGKKTHAIFSAGELPWISRGVTRPDHLDVQELARRSGIDLAATFQAVTGQPFDAAQHLGVTAKSLRFRKGQVIPVHTHLKDLHRTGTIVMLKRIATPGGAILYTDGTAEEENGYQELSANQWAVVRTTMRYYGEVMQSAEVPPCVEMDLWSVGLIEANGKRIAVSAETVVSTDA